jgi:hypothetical protein
VVATYCEMDVVQFFFLWELAGNDAEIGGSLVRGHVGVADKVNCLSDDGYVGLHPLCKAANFICGTLDPLLGLWSKFELGIFHVAMLVSGSMMALVVQ